MDVQRKGMLDFSKVFEESLEQCNFIAIDQEMTGVDFEGRSQSWTMNLNDLFQHSRNVVENYIAFQFGVAIFTLVKDGVYEVKPYNFYLLKESGEFLVSAGALEFLSNHNMNFNKWIEYAMPYCNKNEESELRMMKPKSRYSDIEEKIALILVKKIEDWYNDLNNINEKNFRITSTMNDNIENLALLALGEEECFVALEYKKYQTFLSPPTDIIVSRVEKNVFETYVEAIKQEKTFDLTKELGFRQFWKCITECKKPIIGHNFWLDIMFMVHMHEEPLPSSYEKYKERIHTLFPTIYDTKTLSFAVRSQNPFSSLRLDKLYQYLCNINERADKPLVFDLPPGYHSYDPRCLGSHGKAHEAGYDAYMTGIVFAIIKDVYKNRGGFEINNWENVISVFGSHYYMNLAGKDFLKIKGTFLLNFENDMDVRLLKVLLATRKYNEELKNDQNETFSDFFITYDINKEIGQTFAVQFIDEAINEEEIQKRIESSKKEIDEWIYRTSEEMSIDIPVIKQISRFAMC